MKKQYKIILAILVLEYFCFLLMNKMGIHIESWIGNAIGTILFLSPIFVLLYLIKRDEDISTKIRVFAKILFYFLVVCYIAGGIGKAIVIYGFSTICI